jgi:hypothetical protein
MPEPITLDRGSQFTSNLWLQLCKMLNISHKQTTAYHPESNGALERLHRRLKDALRPRAAAATWPEELHPLYSSDSVHSRGKTLVFPRLRQFLVLQLCCQINLCKMKNFQWIRSLKNFSKTLYVPAISLPRHNSSTQLPAELLSTPLAWVRRGSVIPPLQLLYDGPYESGQG